ncbi:MAG: hypothetical protein IJT70_02795 [Clostridia bacterium]|nr:hypothetical protein [Clostridia bacterium]
MKLDELFCDGAVFAEEKPLRVFGEAEGRVTVRFCGVVAEAVAENGRWIAELPAMSAGGPYELEISADGETVVLKDVYIGRVYLVAGQSNAEFQLSSSNEPKSSYEDDALLRSFFVKRPWFEDDQFDPGDGWRRAESDGVGAWSAIAYLAGRETRRSTGKAVGVITCAQGASVIESWLPAEVSAGYALDKDKLMADHSDPEYSAWNGGGAIFDSMLSPLFPFSLSGVIWYQGESDTTVYEGEIYEGELLSLMRAVREGVRDSALPFAVIQIADYDGRRENDPEGWRAIQHAQARAVGKDPNASLVISKDVCESDCIHPTRKTELSSRAAKALSVEG